MNFYTDDSPGLKIQPVRALTRFLLRVAWPLDCCKHSNSQLRQHAAAASSLQRSALVNNESRRCPQQTRVCSMQRDLIAMQLLAA